MWLTSRAYAGSSGTTGKPTADKNSNKDNKQNHNFVFYEDIDHKHHFTSIGSLMKRDPVIGTKEDDGITIRMMPNNNLVSGEITKRFHSKRYNISQRISHL